MREPMAISVRIHPLHENGNQRVEIGGRLDTHTYSELDDRLTLVLAAKVQSLVLDLAQLEYISSAGVRSIFRARKLLSARGGTLVLANTQPQVQKVFDIVKAVPLSEIFRTVAEADAYLDRIQKKIVAGNEDD
jgi:anti-anti-sigma factor